MELVNKAIFDYKDESDFVIRLRTTSATDEIILAKIERGNSLKEMFDDVQQRIEGAEAHRLEEDDSLKIPILSVDLEHRYQELEQKRLLNPTRSLFEIITAVQRIRFQLDETGARVESESTHFYFNGERHYDFDSPFLIYLKQRDSNAPYLAMWIETP